MLDLEFACLFKQLKHFVIKERILVRLYFLILHCHRRDIMRDAEILIRELISRVLQLLDFLADDLAFVSHQRQEKGDFVEIIDGFHVS